jgi:DNA topoisomerase-1
MTAPADLTVAKALALIRAKAEGPRLLGVDPKTGQNVYAIHGRFGAYVQLGETPEKGVKEKPRRSSLTGGLTESTVMLDDALKLLELPRELGSHPESGQSIVAGLGRFGPYIKHGDDFRSLEAGDDLFTVGLERALALLAQPKRSARQAARRVIRTIESPNGGGALQLLEGRYGPYVTDGEINASIPKGIDPSALTLDEARALIEARRGAPPSERRGRRGAPPARGRRRAPRPVDEAMAPPAKVSVKTAAKPKAAAKTKAKPKTAAKRAVRKRAS